MYRPAWVPVAPVRYNNAPDHLYIPDIDSKCKVVDTLSSEDQVQNCYSMGLLWAICLICTWCMRCICIQVMNNGISVSKKKHASQSLTPAILIPPKAKPKPGCRRDIALKIIISIHHHYQIIYCKKDIKNGNSYRSEIVLTWTHLRKWFKVIITIKISFDISLIYHSNSRH